MRELVLSNKHGKEIAKFYPYVNHERNGDMLVVYNGLREYSISLWDGKTFIIKEKENEQ